MSVTHAVDHLQVCTIRPIDTKTNVPAIRRAGCRRSRRHFDVQRAGGCESVGWVHDSAPTISAPDVQTPLGTGLRSYLRLVQHGPARNPFFAALIARLPMAMAPL